MRKDSTATAISSLLIRCSGLPGRREFIRIGDLASLSMNDDPSRIDDVRDRIRHAEFDKIAGLWGGEPGGDWIAWRILECRNEESYVVEVHLFASLDINDDVTILKRIPASELPAARRAILHWTNLDRDRAR